MVSCWVMSSQNSHTEAVGGQCDVTRDKMAARQQSSKGRSGGDILRRGKIDLNIRLLVNDLNRHDRCPYLLKLGLIVIELMFDFLSCQEYLVRIIMFEEVKCNNQLLVIHLYDEITAKLSFCTIDDSHIKY